MRRLKQGLVFLRVVGVEPTKTLSRSYPVGIWMRLPFRHTLSQYLTPNL